MKLAYFDCSCGHDNVLKCWSKVIRGHTKTCGKCNLLTADHFKNTKYGKLTMRDPHDFTRGSNKKVWWICDCGNQTFIQVNVVTRSGIKSCGKCNVLTKEHFEFKKYYKLRMKDPISIHSGSGQKVWWVCDCGKEVFLSVIDVTRFHAKSCGKCSVLSKTHWETTKFGRLRLADPIDLCVYSNKKVWWICDCGNRVCCIVQNVVRGRTSSCGRCRQNIDNWYAQNKNAIKQLKTPIDPTQIPQDGLVSLDVIDKMRKPFRAICGSCGSEYEPRWEKIKLGISLTCGCSTNRISSAQKEIANFIESLGLKVKLEHQVGSLVYDIFISSNNLLIEYNGLRWHSQNQSKSRDKTKYQNAIHAGFKYVMIFEDEWLSNKQKVEQLLKNRLNLNVCVSVKPSKCDIRKIKSNETDRFYQIYHYIGTVKAKINYGVFYDGKLIACVSFKKPTRQSKRDWELVRMTSDPNYRVHGIWSKLIKLFTCEYSGSIVSFSDNRLFSGIVYQKMGFKFDGEVPPDYYWVKGNKRYHKSGLRKTRHEKTLGLTETQLREAQGYRRIWDLGKKRWVFDN